MKTYKDFTAINEEAINEGITDFFGGIVNYFQKIFVQFKTEKRLVKNELMYVKSFMKLAKIFTINKMIYIHPKYRPETFTEKFLVNTKLFKIAFKTRKDILKVTKEYKNEMKGAKAEVADTLTEDMLRTVDVILKNAGYVLPYNKVHGK